MPIRSVSQWMLDHVSIRLRLAIWYAALLCVTLALFSGIVYTVAQNQLDNSVDQTLKSRAVLIANAVQNELQSSGAVRHTSNDPVPPPSPTVTPTSPPPTATPDLGSSPAPTATAIPTAVPTAEPQQVEQVQKQLKLKVPDLLGQLDLAFEVLNANGAMAYPAPNSSAGPPLPLDQPTIADALHYGMAGQYTQRQQSTGRQSASPLLRVWVQPIFLPGSGQTTGTATAQSTQREIVGVVIVAKPIDDVNKALTTLSHLLAIGVIIAVLFTSLGGWLIAGNGLRPIAGVTRTARAITVNAHAAGLGRRVGYSGPRDEVGELASTFDDMLAAIEQVANAQRRFVADASHELRAPLTTIKGSLEFLRRARDLPEEERAAIVEDAFAEAERMTSLVNDLLLLARADAASSRSAGPHEARLDDQLRGRRELVEVDQLALDIFRHGRAQLQARSKSHIQLSIENLEPVSVLADPGQLRQVMLILLDNAIKYTPASGRVRISVTRQGNRAAISVTDTGIGIEPEVQPHIFERFYRGDKARERDQHGSGLGLAIAKWIIDAHNGEINVYSQPGKGSSFTVVLPAIRRPGEQTSAKVPAVEQRKTTRSVVSGAMSPFARLAGTVSRPRPGKTTVRRLARESKHAREHAGERDTANGAVDRGPGSPHSS